MKKLSTERAPEIRVSDRKRGVGREENTGYSTRWKMGVNKLTL